jgi:hypothetical protein
VAVGAKQVAEADRALDLARLDLDLSVMGISEEQAKRALRHAWLQLAATLILTVGIPVFLRMMQLARGRLAIPTPRVEHPRLNDPAGLRRLMRVLPDIRAIEGLLARVEGNVARAESLLSYVESAAELDLLLKRVPDASALQGLLIGTRVSTKSAGARVGALLDRVGDTRLLDGLLVRTDGARQLWQLLSKVDDPKLLWIYLHELDSWRVARLTSELSAAELARFRSTLGGDQLRQVAAVYEGPQLRSALYEPRGQAGSSAAV